MLKYLYVFMLSYLFGTWHISYLFVKAKNHVDIRSFGTGNSGASNAFINFGAKIGIITAFSDMLKGLFAVTLTRLIFGPMVSILAFSALCAVIGHIYPFYMKFRGGKGLATFIGGTLGISFIYALILFGVLVIVTIIFNYIAIGTISSVVLSACMFFYYYRYSLSTLFYIIIMFLLLYKHIPNMKSIYKKQEPTFRDAVFAKIRKSP